MLKPQIFPLKSFSDERGVLSFCNDLDFFHFKRFYIITPGRKNQIRAWQGHLKEEKVFFPLEGSIKLVALEILNLKSSDFGRPYEFDLNSENPNLVYLPGGFINGFQFPEEDAKLMVFSNFSLDESKSDDFRFEASEFYKW